MATVLILRLYGWFRRSIPVGAPLSVAPPPVPSKPIRSCLHFHSHTQKTIECYPNEIISSLSSTLRCDRGGANRRPDMATTQSGGGLGRGGGGAIYEPCLVGPHEGAPVGTCPARKMVCSTTESLDGVIYRHPFNVGVKGMSMHHKIMSND
jgi:hypothetical protein